MPLKAIHHRHNLPVLRQEKSAISNGCVHLTHKVKRIGIDLQIRNHQGFSAIDVAELFNQEEISKGLRSRWEKLYKTKYEGGPKPVLVESKP